MGIYSKITGALKKVLYVIFLILAVKAAFAVLMMVSNKPRMKSPPEAIFSEQEIAAMVNEFKTENPEGYWVSSEDRIGVLFPSKPERVVAISGNDGGYGYKAMQGNTSYSVSIVPFPEVERPDDIHDKDILLLNHEAFAVGMAADKDSTKQQWKNFSDGRPVLHYQMRYPHAGKTVITKGFWLIDAKKNIRVSASHIGYMDGATAKAVQNFLDSFTLIGVK